MPTLKPLPDCEGPKLECFADDITTHSVKLLGAIGAGCHSEVWKAEIDGKLYAIKLFNHHATKEPDFLMSAFDEAPFEDDAALAASDDMSQSTIDALRLHATSFYNECRAFGRLKELGREDLAIKVYGYLQFDLNNEKVLQYFLPFTEGIRDDLTQLGNPSPTTSDIVCHRLQHYDLNVPIMAIVKDYLPHVAEETMPSKFNQREMDHLPRLLRNLHQLHRSGIVVRDLKQQQYIDGHLIDFSFAWTIPHIFGPESGLRPCWSFESMAAWDLKCFQNILDLFNLKAHHAVPRGRKHKLVAWRNEEVYGRLRTRPQMYGPFLPMLICDHDVQPMKQHPPFDPAKFDWKVMQKKAAKEDSSGSVIKRKAASGKGRKRKSKEGKRKNRGL